LLTDDEFQHSLEEKHKFTCSELDSEKKKKSVLTIAENYYLPHAHVKDRKIHPRFGWGVGGGAAEASSCIHAMYKGVRQGK